MATLPNFKVGDTYQLTCTYKEDGVATSLAGATIESQIRTSIGVLVATMSVAIDADQVTNAGKFTMTSTVSDTSDWPIGDHDMDIQITINGAIRSSETFIQPVIGDVTR